MNHNKTPYKLLQLLSDGEFHSGEQLGAALKISRSAVWKAIQSLQNYAIDIDSVPSRGYRILNGIELLDSDRILAAMAAPQKKQLDHILLFDELDSTNTMLLNHAKQNHKQHLACLAEYQTAGRGRRGRSWVSPFGSNIYASLLWYFEKDPAEIVGVSIAAAVAVLRALQAYGVSNDLSIKWSNDILWKNKKISGILLDLLAEPHEYCAVVLGVGINTHLSRDQAEYIEQPWVSLSHIINTRIERNRLAGLLLNELVAAMNEFAISGLTSFLPTWQAHDALYNQEIILLMPDRQIQGVMRGIDERGALLLETSDGRIRPYFSGEISVRRKL